MHRLIYISKSLIGTDRSDLDAIVKTSAVRNACAGITGVLWFDKNNFAQVLEGDRAAIIETMDRINADEPFIQGKLFSLERTIDDNSVWITKKLQVIATST